MHALSATEATLFSVAVCMGSWTAVPCGSICLAIDQGPGDLVHRDIPGPFYWKEKINASSSPLPVPGSECVSLRAHVGHSYERSPASSSLCSRELACLLSDGRSVYAVEATC